MIMRTAKALLTGMALLCASAARMAAGDEIAGGITSFINRLHPSGTPYFVTYSINRDINFSELEAVLRNDPWFDFPQKRLYFRSFFLQLDDGSGYPDGNPRGIDIPSKIVVDAVSAWTAAQKDLSFFECAVELNGYRLPGVEKLRYHVTNYDPLFYRSFPNVENLDITASGIPDLSFLWRLEKLKKFEISLKEQDKTVLNRLFRQYYDYITTAKTGLEGYVNIKSPYHYPHYDPGGDYIHYYTDPPEWYNGPDISGVPAWLNDDRVNLRREPSLTAPALKQLNTGDFVLIKGRAEIYENTMVYSEGTPWSYAMPWSSEAEYRDEMKQAGKWIKVRLADGTDGYIWGDYLTLKNPRFYPYQKGASAGTFPASRP